MNLVKESLFLLGGVLIIASGWIVQHFASPGTSILIKLLAIISFALGFGGIALLPIDLTATTKYEEETENVQPNETYTSWLVTYWSTFLLAWTILPLVRESLRSGQFTFRSRFAVGCRKAVRGYILLLLVAVVSILVMAVKMHSWHVIPVLMALGNTYGLLLVSLLLGYGLVDVPRKLWQMANPQYELRKTRILASSADEALDDVVWELQDCEALVDDAATRAGDCTNDNLDGTQPANTNGMDLSYAACLDQLLVLRKSTATLSPELQRRRASCHRRNDDNENDNDENDLDNSNGPPSRDYLARLHARLQAAQADVVSAEQLWNTVVAKSRLYSALVEGTIPRPMRGSTEASDSLSRSRSKCNNLVAYLEYFWLVYARNTFYRLLGMACAGLSGAVLWSEATLAVPWKYMSPFSIALDLFDKGDRGILFQIAAMVPLLYMSICVYGSLFKLSLFGRYRLRGDHQSPAVALVFNAQYLVRLQFPLGYNYLFLIKYDTSTTDCAFSHVMSDMSTVPFFGTSFSVYAPLLIIALCAFTLCNGYARLLALLGIDHEDAILLADPETLDGKVNEGISLLERHARAEANATKHSPNKDASRSRLIQMSSISPTREDDDDAEAKSGWKAGIV